MYIFDKKFKVKKKRAKPRTGEKAVVVRSGKGMWGAFYLKPARPGLEGKGKPSEKILEKEGNTEVVPCQLSIHSDTPHPLKPWAQSRVVLKVWVSLQVLDGA